MFGLPDPIDSWTTDKGEGAYQQQPDGSWVFQPGGANPKGGKTAGYDPSTAGKTGNPGGGGLYSNVTTGVNGGWATKGSPQAAAPAAPAANTLGPLGVPGAMENYYNGVAGKMMGGNWSSGLDTYYNNAADQGGRALDAQAAAQGGYDSGANLRAHQQLATSLAGQKQQAEQSWLQTGGSLAAAAEGAANNRLTGQITNQLAISNPEASAMQTGLTAADQDQLDLVLTQISGQIQSGQISASAGQAQAKNTLALMGQGTNAAANYYVMSKLGGTTTSSAAPTGSSLSPLNTNPAGF